jgi:hypothetical protein
MTQLSPQAQAVLDAVCENTEPDCDTQHLIAAALRAVVDQVVPPSLETEFYDRNPSLTLQKAVEIRAELLAIANELQAQ